MKTLAVLMLAIIGAGSAFAQEAFAPGRYLAWVQSANTTNENPSPGVHVLGFESGSLLGVGVDLTHEPDGTYLLNLVNNPDPAPPEPYVWEAGRLSRRFSGRFEDDLSYDSDRGAVLHMGGGVLFFARSDGSFAEGGILSDGTVQPGARLVDASADAVVLVPEGLTLPPANTALSAWAGT